MTPRFASHTDTGAEASAAVTRAAEALARGRMVLVADDSERENEGDLICAAETITEAQMAFMLRHGSGLVCAPMTRERADALQLPPMVGENADAHGTAFTVSVDHAGAGTGVSAADRRLTVRALAGDATTAEQLHRPGHVFPLRAREGGVLERPGHTEAALDLLRIARRQPVAAITELANDDGSMMSGSQLDEFAARFDLELIRVADIISHRWRTEPLVEAVASSFMPTRYGEFAATVFRSRVDDTEHLALTMGDVATAGGAPRGVLVRVHSECLTGDVIGSLRCDCGAQLERALEAIAREGCGVVVYLRGHEGRGIGLAHKIRAYALQEGGLDTVDANTVQGLPIDARSYGVGAQILAEVGARRLRLITNNPAKYVGIRSYGLEIVERVKLATIPTAENLRYLETKRTRMGHDVDPRVGDAER